MAEKVLNTRIQLKYDSYANWTNATLGTNKGANLVLKAGEIGICYLPANYNDNQVVGSQPPQILMKVGDGSSKFSELPWTSAKAADVYAWAKQASLPVTKVGDGNVVSNISWDEETKGIKFTTASVATSEELTNLTTRVKAIEDTYVTSETLAATVEALNAAIALKADKTYVDGELAKKVNSSDFETFKTNNTQAIATAQNAAVAAAKTETENQVKALRESDVAANASAISAIKDHASVDSFADVMEEMAKYQLAGDYATKTEAQGYADAKDEAIQAAQNAADAAQSDVDELKAYVGEFTPTEGVDTVIDYIDAKTAGIASESALSALTGRVAQAEADIDAIEADYLKAADKTELSNAISAEAERAAGVEAGLEERLAAVEADYLVEADKTELEGKINAKVAQADYDVKVAEIKDTTDSLQTQINTIFNNPDAEGAINSINEFTKYIEDHGEIADGFRADINANAAAISTEAQTARAAEEALAGRLDTLEAIDHDAYKAADTALKNELSGEIAKKADTTALEAAVEALEGADTTIKERLDAVEAQLGDGEGSVADLIADAKQEAIDAAAEDATSKANAAEAAAKGHADSLNTAMNGRVEALESLGFAAGDKAKLDTAVQTVATSDGLTASKSGTEVTIAFDDNCVFIFNCGSSETVI